MTCAFAPGTTTIWFSPSSSTRISAIPVVPVALDVELDARASSPASASSASGSSPTAPTIRTVAPSRAAATAWFAPLPPGNRSKLGRRPSRPAAAARSTRATRSRLIDPTTVSSTGTRAGSGGDRAQIVERAAEQVLAQVEQARPERAAVDRSMPAHLRREAFERADEHGQLEVGRGDAVRARP